MELNIEKIVRPNILKMKAYSAARHEFAGEARIFLDANENSFGSPLPEGYNRYPDPMQRDLKQKLSEIKGLPPENIFLGNGSDEAIDLLMRIFCEPGRDNIIVLPPTYGMYEVCAAVNNIAVRNIPLLENFQPDLENIAAAIDPFTRIIFICSPNNPTGNVINRGDVELLLNNFDGIVAIDEAYINFSRQKTWARELADYSNLVILQTLSKAWGLAALRIGMAYASGKVISLMNKIKYPYNISSAAQRLALTALNNIDQVNEWTRRTVQQRELLASKLASQASVVKVYPSDANFLLVKMRDAGKAYEYLASRGIITRDRSGFVHCENCLRITVGTDRENEDLIKELKSMPS